MTGVESEDSKHLQNQRFIGEYNLDYGWISLLVLLLLPQKARRNFVDKTT